MSFRTRSTALAAMLSLGLPALATPAQAATYAPWLTQIGLSDAVESKANWGKGQWLGVVDTGIVANSRAFTPEQVSTALSSCAAVSFKCPNGYVDDNGHGTAVASIAAAGAASPFNATLGVYRVGIGNVIGVAPNASILAEKALNAGGTAYSTDVANGLRKAADAGAGVVNLSVSYGNSADMVAAINYAASKGAFMVWAGGNSAQTLLKGANTNGLTAAAVSRLVFAGSVSATNTLSSFSNTPGTGALATGSKKVSYATRWIMAPGERILGPAVTAGPNAWAAWSGTSMAAPLVSGSLLLLQSAWPILKTNGTAADLLLTTASDLGAKGVDVVYGNGLVNLTAAFQPYGTLAVTQADGQAIAVSALNGALIAKGALGNLPAVQSKLANYMAFDGYARNFAVDLSGMIKTPPVATAGNPLPQTGVKPRVLKLADGRELSYTAAPAAEAAGLGGMHGEAPQGRHRIHAMLTDAGGNVTALGYGHPVQYSFARTLYGDDDMARLSAALEVGTLGAIAQGGGLFAHGTKLGEATRVAFSWSSTAPRPTGTTAAEAPAWTSAKASNLGVGLVHRLTPTFAVGINFGSLAESHGMLGSTYDPASALSLGDANRTRSVGFTAGVTLDRDSSLLLEAAFARTRGNAAGGLVAGTSDVGARAYGIVFMRKDFIEKQDRFTFAVKQPLRVVSGQAFVMMPGVDEQGISRFEREGASLVPSGREIDYRMSYDVPLAKNRSVSLQAGMRKDMLHVAGNREASVGAVWSSRF